MNIHEYQGKAVLKQFGAPVPRGLPAFTPEEAADAAAKEDYVSDMGVSVASGEMAYGEDKPAPPPATIARAENPR